jgi:hypothetical protein
MVGGWLVEWMGLSESIGGVGDCGVGCGGRNIVEEGEIGFGRRCHRCGSLPRENNNVQLKLPLPLDIKSASFSSHHTMQCSIMAVLDCFDCFSDHG